MPIQRPVENLRLGDYARGGLSVGAAVRSDIGKFGRRLARFVGFDRKKVRGKWYTEAAYLGDRGPLLGLGLELTERRQKKTKKEKKRKNRALRSPQLVPQPRSPLTVWPTLLSWPNPLKELSTVTSLKLA